MIAKNGKGEPRSAQRKSQADEKGDRMHQQVTELLLYSLHLPWRVQIPTTCATLNSLVQAFMWMYSVGASARNADFGDLHPLLRPLSNSTGTVQLHRRKAWLGVMRAWACIDQQQTYLTRRLNVPVMVGSWEARAAEGVIMRLLCSGVPCGFVSALSAGWSCSVAAPFDLFHLLALLLLPLDLWILLLQCLLHPLLLLLLCRIFLFLSETGRFLLLLSRSFTLPSLRNHKGSPFFAPLLLSPAL